MAVRLGELLLKEKRITPAQLQEALNYQKTNGGKLGLNLVKMGFLKDEDITALLSKQYGVPFINLAEFEIDASIIKLIPSETAHKYQIVPLSRSGATLTIAMTDPTNVFAMDDIKFMTGYNVEPVVASEAGVFDAIARYYKIAAGVRGAREAVAAPTGDSISSAASLEMVTKALEETSSIVDDDVELLQEMEQIDVASLERQGGEAPVIRLVNLMLMSAIQKGASDIHVEPVRKGISCPLPHRRPAVQRHGPADEVPDAITSRIKIMAKLDIAEKRLPQDGRIKIRFADNGTIKEMDFRVSCLPTLFGEKIVMRLLDKDKLMLDMTKLGFEATALTKLETAISSRGGWCWSPGRPAAARRTRCIHRSRRSTRSTPTS